MIIGNFLENFIGESFDFLGSTPCSSEAVSTAVVEDAEKSSSICIGALRCEVQ